MQRLEQQAQAVAAKDVTAKLREKVLFVRFGSFLPKLYLTAGVAFSLATGSRTIGSSLNFKRITFIELKKNSSVHCTRILIF